MKRYANAKVNLALDVLSRNEAGYHDLDMIMAPISLCDVLEFEPNGTHSHQVYFNDVLVQEKNTVSSALEALEKAGMKNHYTVHVEKRIPMEAGLAGGSADAACVLNTLNEVENLGLTPEQLGRIGAAIGADVPFCLHNQIARVQGIGEKITPVETTMRFPILLVKPEPGVSTPACFKKWDENPGRHYDIDIVADALTGGSMDLLYQTMENALEPCAFQLVPELEEVRQAMLENDLVKVLMTGSGSALMGFSVDYDVLKKAAQALKKSYPFVEIVEVG